MATVSTGQSSTTKAAGELGYLRDPQAFEPLLALLQDPVKAPAARAQAAAALGSIGDKRATRVLVRYLDDADLCWAASRGRSMRRWRAPRCKTRTDSARR